MNEILPVILSGGNGTRLWPLSRKSYPKQYLNLEKESKYTLLQNTFLRLSKIKDILNPLIICNEEHRFIVAEQMRNIDVEPFSILLEPAGRNTAPAITLAALKAIKEVPSGSIVQSNQYAYDLLTLVKVLEKTLA